MIIDDPSVAATLDEPQEDQLPAPEEQAPPQESDSSTETPSPETQDGMASIFANRKDLWRYRMAKLNGASEQQALSVGDNGIGKWGDITASYKTPMVALPSDTPGLDRNRLVRVTGPEGSVVAKVGDVMPRSDRLQGKSNIDLNPAAALAVGHPGGVTPVTWQWADDQNGKQPEVQDAPPLGDESELPSPQSPPPATPAVMQRFSGRSSMRGMGGLGNIPSQDEITEGNALAESVKKMEVKTRNPGGSVTMSDGATKIYPGGIVVYQRGAQVFERLPDGHIKQVGTSKQSSQKSDEDLLRESAAKKGVLRSDFPEGDEGDKAYRKQASDALQASRSGVGTDPGVIAESIISGDQPPDLAGLYGRSGAVRTELAKKKYPLAEARLDWDAVKRYMATLNGPQQVRLRQATEFVRETVPLVRQLSSDVTSAVPRSQFPVFNAAALAAARQGTFGHEAQDAATRLSAQINDMQSELGIMYSGGNSSTDAKLKQAKDMISGNWSEEQLNAALDLIETNSQLRLNSIKNTGVQSLTPSNRYTPPGESPTPSPPASPAPSAKPSTPAPTDPKSAIAEAQRRLKANPNDEKAQRVLQLAKDLSLTQ